MDLYTLRQKLPELPNREFAQVIAHAQSLIQQQPSKLSSYALHILTLQEKRRREWHAELKLHPLDKILPELMGLEEEY